MLLNINILQSTKHKQKLKVMSTS